MSSTDMNSDASDFCYTDDDEDAETDSDFNGEERYTERILNCSYDSGDEKTDSHCNDDEGDATTQPLSAAMEQLRNLLLSVNDLPVKFATTGILESPPLPGLHIKGVGPISLPLCEEQAKVVIAVAKKAPYGLGEKTIVDENYRKTWEISPDQIKFTNHLFEKKIENLVTKVRVDLGCNSDSVKANLYKVLLYEEGGFFKAHRDSEKEEGMFGTLIVQLPSIFKGNHLIIRHGSETKTVEFDNERSPHEIVYAAHYSDCEHEITPLLSGYRMALIYNLVRDARYDPPSLTAYGEIEKDMISSLQQIDAKKEGVFGWAFEHKYSHISLEKGIAALKGKDRLIALALDHVNTKLEENSRFIFYITEIKRTDNEFCWDEEGDGPFRSDCSQTSLEVGFTFSGQRRETKKIKFDLKKDSLNMKKDKDVVKFWGKFVGKSRVETTGNEGSTRDKWYRSYLLLAIHPKMYFQILCENSVDETLDYLSQDSSTDFHEHVRTFLEVVSPSSYKEESTIKAMRFLAKLADMELIKLFVTNLLGKKLNRWDRSAFGLKFPGTVSAFSDLLRSIAWEDLKPSIEEIIPQCEVQQFHSWLEVAELSALPDISHKVAQVLIEKIKYREVPKVWSPSTRSREWSPRNREDMDLVALLFQQMFKDEALFSTWWHQMTSLPEIMENIGLLSVLLSKLPIDHPTGYVPLLDYFISATKSKVLSKGKIDPSHMFNAVKSVIDVPAFHQKLIELCDILLTVGNVLVISCLLGHLFEFKATLLETEGFKIFLNTSIDWIDRTEVDLSHCTEIVNVAVVAVKCEDKVVFQKFIRICANFTDFRLLCKVIENFVEKKELCTEKDALVGLLTALIGLVEQNSSYIHHIEPLILIMFKDDAYTDLLRKFMQMKEIATDAELLSNLLFQLCDEKNSENVMKLKSNVNFRSVLLNFSHVFPQEVENWIDHSTYVRILRFLFTDEDWCAQVSPDLLPALISAKCIKQDFTCFAKVIDAMPFYQTTNYNFLLTTAVDALDTYLDKKVKKDVPSAQFEMIKKFVMTLMRPITSEIFTRFLNLPHLKTNDISSMFLDAKSVLEMLISDVKVRCQNSELFNELVSKRKSNINEVLLKGEPQFSWEQPEATLPDHPMVEQFLKSDKQKFVYRNFEGKSDVRKWVKKHFGYGGSSYWMQLQNGYCCDVESKYKGTKFYAVLTKNPQKLLEEKQKKFRSLTLELSRLSERTSSLKRPLADATAVLNKKPFHP